LLPAQPNKSVLDAVEVILALAASGKGIGSRELARSLGMEPTRANRLLKTLAGSGVASQTVDHRYVPGPGMHVLSAMSLRASNLIPAARPSLEELSTLGHTVALGVLWRDKVAYLYHWKPGFSFSEAIGRVGLFDASRSSIGIILLSALARDEVDGRYPDGVPIPGFAFRDLFYGALERARATGFAVVPAEANGTTRAAAIGNTGAPPYAAVAVSGEISGEEERTVTEAVVRAANQISQAIGK
jgi:DNA-binding IclR family transcriptional regulator